MNDFLKIHPSAAKNFDQKASCLVMLVKELSRKSQLGGFKSERHVAAKISDKEMIGEPVEAETDYRGAAVARYCLAPRYLDPVEC